MVLRGSATNQSPLQVDSFRYQQHVTLNQLTYIVTSLLQKIGTSMMSFFVEKPTKLQKVTEIAKAPYFTSLPTV